MPSAMATPVRQGQGDGALQSAVLAAFPERLLPRNSTMVSSLESLLRIYSSRISAEDLYYKAEAILVTDRADQITPDIVEQLRQSMAQEWEKSLGSKSNAMTSTPAKSSAGAAALNFISTPGSKQMHNQQPRSALGSFLGISPSTPATPLNRGSRFVQEDLGHNLITQDSPAQGSPAHFQRGQPSSSMATPSSSSLSSPSNIVETLNPHIAAVQSSRLDQIMDVDGDAESKDAFSANHPRVALAIGTDPRTWNYRYMFERPGTKSQALDEQIESITQAVLETYGIADEDLADPATPSQESVYVVGRIAPTVGKEENAKTGHAKLSEGIVIEASRRIGSGSRTPLHLASNLKMRPLKGANGEDIAHSSSTGGQVALFPGLIAGFRGRNGGGDAFIVEEILMPPSHPPATTPVKNLLQYHHDPTCLDGEPLQVMIAAGPFTNDRDLEFKPWHRLMDVVERDLPDVLLLLGPFLSANNAALMDPDLDLMPDQIFEQHICQRLNRLCEKTTRTTAILLPSTRDMISPHAAWPQPMLEKMPLGLHKRVKCLPNPCLFSINEVIIGASTADVLRDVRAEEIVVDLGNSSNAAPSNASERDAMARSVRHILHQRHFYPLYPASMTSEVPLDVSHAKLAAFTGVSPDLLLLPGVLTPFAKVIDGSVVVNPGMTARGTGGSGQAQQVGSSVGSGTIVKLQVQPMAKDALLASQAQGASYDNDESVTMQHGLYDRTRVDIIRF